MLSTMNTDNLSGAFCLKIYCYQSFASGSKTGDTPMDKRAILWTKETSPRQNVDAFPASPEKLVSPDSP